MCVNPELNPYLMQSVRSGRCEQQATGQPLVPYKCQMPAGYVSLSCKNEAM